MMFGDVPTSVINPPSSDPNDIGIRNCEGEVFDFLAIWNAAGISIANAPMFFTSADRKVTDPTSRNSCELARDTPLDSRASAASITPERATAALTINAEAT